MGGYNMKNKNILILLTAAAICLGAVSCSAGNPQEATRTTTQVTTQETEAPTTTTTEATTTTTTTAATTSTTETTEETDPSADWDINNELSEPVIKDVSETVKDLTFVRNGKNIAGRLYLPEGDGPFPVVVFSCGLLEPFQDYESRAERFAKNGYAAVLFDFTMNIDGSYEKYITVHEDKWFEFTNPVDEERVNGQFFRQGVEELYAVIDSLGYLPKVDTENIYLGGHSMGGQIASYTGSVRQDEIKGLILVEPTIAFDEDLLVSQDPYIRVELHYKLSFCKLNTLIYIGTHDGYGDMPDSFDDVLKLMKSGELVTIDGADHSFAGKDGDKMVDDACEHIKTWNK